jgi:hypothetical protein
LDSRGKKELRQYRKKASLASAKRKDGAGLQRPSFLSLYPKFCMICLGRINQQFCTKNGERAAHLSKKTFYVNLKMTQQEKCNAMQGELKLMIIGEKNVSDETLKLIRKYTKRKKIVKLEEMLSYSFSVQSAAVAYSSGSGLRFYRDEEKRELLKNYSAKIRKEAATALGTIEKKETLAPLLNALGDVDGGVRISAAQALKALGHGAWAEIITGDDSDYERLGASKNNLAVFPLIYALKWADENSMLFILEKAFKCLAEDEKNEAAFAGMVEANQKIMQNLMNFGQERRQEGFSGLLTEVLHAMVGVGYY